MFKDFKKLPFSRIQLLQIRHFKFSIGEEGSDKDGRPAVREGERDPLLHEAQGGARGAQREAEGGPEPDQGLHEHQGATRGTLHPLQLEVTPHSNG